MSYDIWLEVDLGGSEPVALDLAPWNYTSNCGPMWRLAGADLAEYHGQQAAACLPSLKAAIADMEAHPDKYTPLNPENGWGSLESLIPALYRLVSIFEMAPQASVYVSR